MANAMANASDVDGARKALLLLVSLDESIATRVLSHLEGEDVRALRDAATGLKEVEPDVVVSIHQEFASTLNQGVPASLAGSGAYLRRIAGKALGEGKTAELWEEPREPSPLNKLPAKTMLTMLENEQPQTIAVVLSQLEPAQASDIISSMPSEQQTEVLLRLSKLQSVPSEVIIEIQDLFERQVEDLADDIQVTEINGIDAAAGVLKRLGDEVSSGLIETVTEKDGELGALLAKAMFRFEDLLRIEGRGIQALLKEVSTDQLTVALKTASDELKEKVFANLSSRAATMLQDELEMMGPVRLADVEEAQQAIIQVAVQLEKDEKITIAREGGGGGDFV